MVGEIKMSKKWEKCVAEAKKVARLLRLKTQHRMKIAELALQACTIIRGGRQCFENLSIRRFSEAIGINEKTIYEWIRVYETVYAKLDEVNRESALEVHYDVVRNVRAAVDPDTMPEVVNATFVQEAAKPRDSLKWMKYLSRLRSIMFNVKNPRAMADVTDEQVQDMISRCNVISATLQRELEFRRKWSGQEGERFAPVTVKAKDVWDEVDV